MSIFIIPLNYGWKIMLLAAPTDSKSKHQFVKRDRPDPKLENPGSSHLLAEFVKHPLQLRFFAFIVYPLIPQ